MDGMKELSHDRDLGLHLGLAVVDDEVVGEGHDMGLPLNGVVGGHEQSRPQVLVPGFGDAGLALEVSGFEVTGIQSGMSDPLWSELVPEA